MLCLSCPPTDMLDRPVDIYKETATERIAIKWKHEVDDLEDWFKSRGIGLTWSYDLDDQWTVFQAESVVEANAIMQAILDIMHGKPGKPCIKGGGFRPVAVIAIDREGRTLTCRFVHQ